MNDNTADMLLSQLVDDLYARLVREGLTPEIAANQSKAEQYAYLQEMTFREFARCRQRGNTERRQAEEELSRLSAQRQLALDAARLGWWHYDPVTQIAKYDQRYREIFEVTGSERPNEEILTRLHPNDLPGVWAKVEAALNPADPKPYAAEYRIFLPDGRIRWIEAHGIATFAGEGQARQATSLVGTVADITERKHAEEALRESRTKLEAALESMTDAVFISDAEGNFIDFNQEFATFHRFNNKEEAARTFAEYPEILDVFFADGKPAPVDQWAVPRALRGERVTNAVYILRRKDTGETWVGSYSFAPIRDEDGTIIGSVVIGRDITEQKRAEDALRDSEARFSAMANNISQLAWMADETGWIFWYNRRWYEYTGTTPEQMEGWGWQQVHDSDVLPRVLAQWQQSIATGEPFDMEFPLRGADGRFRPFLTRIFPVKDVGGRVKYWFGTNTDISEIRQAQNELLELNRTLEQRVQERTEQLTHSLANAESARMAAEMAQVRFQSLLDAVPDGVVIVDDAGNVTFINKQTEALSGYTYDELCGQSVDLLVPERARDHHVRHRADYMAAPRTRPINAELNLYLRRKDGEELPVEISLSPAQTPAGMLVIASIRDITARKAAEAEITRLNTALQRNVEQLTAANKELEAFSYSVSHDLRAPLRGIDGFSKILLERYTAQLDAAGQDYLTRVRAAALRMGRLIEDMLKLSRLGRAEMRVATVNFSTLAAAVIEELRQRDPERQVWVEIQPELTVHGDAGLLRIVLDNLLGNAWKFTEKTPQARIEVGMLTRDGERVYFVRDNGAGFDMTHADKLFIPFQRLHTEEEFPGTGIGLAIVQRIITRHEGRVWAEGEEGHGATVYFTIGEEAR